MVKKNNSMPWAGELYLNILNSQAGGGSQSFSFSAYLVILRIDWIPNSNEDDNIKYQLQLLA